ncbi:MAG: hypothetical protein ACP5NV_03505 [Candidatus Woesearchaeota archaeon]
MNMKKQAKISKNTNLPKTESHSEKQSGIIKIISAFCILILVANIFLFAFRVYSAITMWIIIILMALIAFPGMKILKSRVK